MRFLTAAGILLTIFCATFSFSDQIPEEDVTKSRLQLGPDRWVQFHYFLQTTADAAEYGSHYEYDAQITRSRLIMNGQVAENVFFFAQTDDLTAGSSSTDSTSDESSKLFTQDAYINFYLARSFQVYAGLLTVPYLRYNIQSQAATLCATDSQLTTTMTNFSNNGRDTGLMLRGLLLNGPVFEYRLGVFEGYSNSTDGEKNSADSPRISLRTQFSFLKGEEDNGYFLSDNYIGKKNDISLGLGFDYQKGVTETSSGKFKDYYAWTLDLNVDIAASPMAVFNLSGWITMNTNNPGEGLYDDDNDSTTPMVLDYKNFTIFNVQAGMLFFSHYQPVARFVYRKNNDALTGVQTLGELSGGLNFFINGHNAAIKLLYTQPFFENKNIDGTKRFDISAQIYM